MKTLYRKSRLMACTLLLSITIACGGLLSSIRSGWAAVKPFTQTLVLQQVITQEKADSVSRDVDDTLKSGEVAERCVKDIPSDLPKNERKVKKAHCYFTFAQDFRVVLARHNIGGNPQLDRIAAIGEGFIFALEEYFRSVTGGGGMAARAIAGVPQDADRKLESDLDAKLKELKAATNR